MDDILSSMPGAIPESLRVAAFGQPGLPSVHRPQIQKVRYTHDSMIDQIIGSPWISQNELAAHYGFTASWVSNIIASDAFQARLAERKNELVDPSIRATIEERFKALVLQSISVLQKKLEGPLVSDELALGAVNVAAKALGYGAKAPAQINNNFVVQVPAKLGSSAEWAEQHAPVATYPRPVESKEVAPDTAGTHREAGLPTDAEIVTAAPVKAPAPLRPDPEKLLRELIGG